MNNNIELKTLDDLKSIIKRNAIIYKTGGIRPTNEINESWIGKVCWKKANEEKPTDEDGKEMIPLLTLFLDESLYIPEELNNYKLITVYMSDSVFNFSDRTLLADKFLIRKYENIDELIRCDETSDYLSAFPLVPEQIDDDCPVYDDITYDENYEDFVLKKEDEGFDYLDVCDCHFGHKLGGYPAGIQGGMGWQEGFSFVLQIFSDEKAGLNVVDNGALYFAYNKEQDKWEIHCDFY